MTKGKTIGERPMTAISFEERHKLTISGFVFSRRNAPQCSGGGKYLGERRGTETRSGRGEGRECGARREK